MGKAEDNENYPELTAAFAKAERSSQAFLDEKMLTLLVAMGAGCIFAILNHKLRPGAPVFFFMGAATSFVVAIGLLLRRIWFRPYTALIGIPTDIDTKWFERHDQKLGAAFAVFAGLGLISALLVTVGEVRCYDKPAGLRCDDVLPSSARTL